jgi:hypothetical protein
VQRDQVGRDDRRCHAGGTIKLMSDSVGLRVVGTIRTIELYASMAKFHSVAPRQVARIVLEIEQAIDEDGSEINVDNLAGMHFQGPAELVPLFESGERVQIVTTSATGMHIASIRPAPLS